MPDPAVILASVLNGITTGSIYALVALGLTLIYGVLHIINFAHGSLLMVALYAAFFCYTLLGIDPYLAMFLLVPAFFCVGYLLQRYIIAPIRFGRDQNVLIATVAVAMIVDNGALLLWTSTTRTIDVPYANGIIDLGVAFLPVSRVVAFFAAVVIALIFWAMMVFTDLGRAIRAVAREQHGARLVGINVDHIYATSFGIGTAGVAAAACLLLPSFYITPQVGYTFVLVAFTTVVLGGMGSFIGALVGGILLGVVEALSGLYLGESLGQIGIFLIFIIVLLVRPDGLFGRAAGA
jgi:branched-chain amino acid transport system permease protein